MFHQAFEIFDRLHFQLQRSVIIDHENRPRMILESGYGPLKRKWAEFHEDATPSVSSYHMTDSFFDGLMQSVRFVRASDKNHDLKSA